MNENKLRHYWNIITICLAFFIGLWVPLRMVRMQVDPFWDMALEFLTVLHLALHYLWIGKTENAGGAKLRRLITAPSLIFDILAGLPLVGLTMILWPNVGDNGIYLLATKLFLVRKILLVRSVVDAYDGLHPVIARLIPIGFTMPTVIHFLACGWIFLGGGNAAEYASQGLGVIYIRSVYWVITTLSTVGYGDITPSGIYQMIYSNITMFIGLAFFGFVLSNVASVLARMDAAREDYLASLDQVESFMRQNNIPAPLRLRVRNYYRYLWENHWGRDDGTVLQTLPLKLRQDIALHINQEMIEKVPFLKGAETNLVKDIVTELKPLTVIPQEDVFRQGDPGEAMYFIHRGSIEIISASGQVLATLQPGSFFGEGALLTSNPRNAAARSESYADLYVLHKETFDQVLARYPDFAEFIHNISQERLKAS